MTTTAPRPATARTRLIVNADDYGLTVGVSGAILDAHRSGVVTSTSVLVLGRGFAPSAPWLTDCPDLDVGAHLALTGEDPPLLSAREVPTLVDRSGRLPASWRVLVARQRRIDPDDLRRELGAQLDALDGVRLTHVDTHQHVHLVPAIGRAVCGLAVERGVPYVRVPWSRSHRPTGFAVRALARRLRALVDESDLATSEAFAGLDGAGHLGQERLEVELRRLARERPATAELNVHPGPGHDPDRSPYRWRYEWGGELAAVTSGRTRALLDGLALTPGRRPQRDDVR